MTTDSILLTPVITLLSIAWLTFVVLPASLVNLGVGLVNQLKSYLFKKKLVLLNGEASHGVYKSILITGAATGIGRELAHIYASLDTTVSLGLVDINEEQLEKTAQEIRNLSPKIKVFTYIADVRKAEEMQQLIKDFDKNEMDLVIANAGIFIFPHDGTTQLTNYSGWEDDARKTFEVNLLGVINTINPAISLFKTRKNGHVVATCSTSSFYGPPVLASYGASKAAVFRYVRDLGSQLKKDNIYTTCVCPGFVDTPLTRNNPREKKHKLPFLQPVNKTAKIIVQGIARRDETISFPFIVHVICWLGNCTPPLIMNQIQRLMAN
ncbi:NAD(P)-binding protein, partial [Basidiobolus meristosporus CBS 931.73]